MIHDNKTSRVWLTASLLGAVLLVSGLFVTAMAQDGAANNAQPQQKSTAAKKIPSAGRDPFRKYEPPRVVEKKIANQVPVASIQERINRYKAQKAAAMSARMPAPKPTTALLLSEIEVIGISRTPRGYAAIVEATPIKLSYVIYPGETFYDGQLVAIEDNRLVFRRETVFSDGHRETKPFSKSLRQPSSVNSVPAPGGTAVAAANP
ncbi:MAG TPA: hypothetical protein VGK82_07065 [Pyrinomonadaceae bacterium]